MLPPSSKVVFLDPTTHWIPLRTGLLSASIAAKPFLTLVVCRACQKLGHLSQFLLEGESLVGLRYGSVLSTRDVEIYEFIDEIAVSGFSRGTSTEIMPGWEAFGKSRDGCEEHFW